MRALGGAQFAGFGAFVKGGIGEDDDRLSGEQRTEGLMRQILNRVVLQVPLKGSGYSMHGPIRAASSDVRGCLWLETRPWTRALEPSAE